MAWPTINVGKTVLDGTFQVKADLGGGAFGRVYLVERLAPQTWYAFKTPRENFERDQLFLENFVKEAQGWAQLPAHQNLVKADHLFYFKDQGGRPFISMEYIAGCSLQKVLDGQKDRLAVAQAFAYGLGVCEGMKYVTHKAGAGYAIVHRDISPDNILISKAFNEPKVTDFGLARAEGSQSLHDVAGKWPYMAPEVAKGLVRRSREGELVDRRADIYSWGAMMYVLLTGQRAIDFRGKNWGELANEILTSPPRPIADNLPQDAQHSSPEFLQTIMRCLAKDPAQRPQTWDALVQELRGQAAAIEATAEDDVCQKCGFKSRHELLLRECPVCQHTEFKRREKKKEPAVASLLGETLNSRQQPEFLRIPPVRAVLGANITALRHMRQQAQLNQMDVSRLQFPSARMVAMPAFEISRAAVTEHEYAAFEAATGYRAQRHSRGRGDLPVAEVTFQDAEAYCDWLGCRLPTADEWEVSARGVDGRLYPWGNEFMPGMCVSAETGATGPESVDSRPQAASPYGLLNCVGNVGELVDTGSQRKKLVLGGSYEDVCRYYGLLWTRVWQVELNERQACIGFRVAADVEKPPPFEPKFVRLEGKTVLGCDPAFLPLLECRLPLSGDVMAFLQANKARVAELAPFEMAVHPITNEEYWQFVSATGHPTPRHWNTAKYSWTKRPFLNKYAHHPVTYVTHADAVFYCQWRSQLESRRYELPTGDQWEAAARGPELRVYPWGDEFDSQRVNGAESSLGRTADVRDFAAGDSPDGCRQMVGNVFEWLSTGAGELRNIRGGAFDAACEIYGMTFLEIKTPAASQSANVGFRVVRKA